MFLTVEKGPILNLFTHLEHAPIYTSLAINLPTQALSTIPIQPHFFPIHHSFSSKFPSVKTQFLLKTPVHPLVNSVSALAYLLPSSTLPLHFLSLPPTALSYLFPSSPNNLFPVACASGCTACFGPGANECTACDQSGANKYLQNFSCVSACTAPNVNDPEDNICKSSKYDTDNICPAGKYNPLVRGTSSSSCSPCDGGRFCKTTGLDAVSGACLEGFYCTGGALFRENDDHLVGGSGTGGRCKQGNFCPTGATSQNTCTLGKYCAQDYLSAVSGDCLARYYCAGGTTAERPTNLGTQGGEICPKGKYCPAGASAATDCPAGTYQPNFGAAAEAECLSCPPGNYCSASGLAAPSGVCSSGFYCEGGNKSPSPATAVCAIGHYCPAGSVQQIICNEANYQSAVKEDSCPLCPNNNYCFETNSPKVCDAGYYCPGGNKKKPCFPGKYGDTTGQATEPTACKTCPAGKACELFGTTTNTKTCKAGYYCEAGSITPIPKNASEKGGRCSRGFYCPEGSSAEIACPGGKYCEKTGLSEPSGNCEKGYFCTGSTTRQNPLTGQGAICPDGHYCPEGSSSATPCPIGTYRDAEGGTVLADCFACPKGFYCATQGLASYTSTQCAAGYYCPESQTTGSPVAYKCPAGSYCPANSKLAKKCAVGYYQPNEGQVSCIDCPAGKYCDGVDTSSAIPCIIGYYCPQNTRYSTEYPCPEGTYNDVTSVTQSSDCKPCPAGYYCDQKGLTAFSKKIMAGYYSKQTNQVVGNPSFIANQRGICITGHYCPEGTANPIACPAGTYNNAEGAKALSECLKCPPGEYCNASGKTYAELVALGGTSWGKCTQGYVCYPGSTTTTPNDNIMGIICPVGHYCPTGTFKQIKCSTGTFASSTGAATCTNCPAGKYCNEAGMSTTLDCPQGHYCIAASVLPKACPPGTFNTNSQSTSLAACTACPAQHYCDEEGMVNYNTNKKCSSGYLCTGGSDSAYPIELVDRGAGNNRKCPTGHYCLQGATTPSVCGTGTYQNSLAQSMCKSCPPGYYCSSTGRSTPNGACAAGYICYEGAISDSPTDGTTGEKCPIGSACASGSAYALACEDGKKTTVVGQAVCTNCIAGTYCVGSTEYPCPIRRYCVAGSARGELCEAGTFNDASTGLTAATACTSCPARQYCIDGTKGSGYCESGVVCTGGATTPKPTGVFGTDANYQCPIGRYCLKAGPSGTNAPIDCSASKYTYELGSDSIDDCLLCAAGYYCPTGGYTPISCEVGKYCVKGSIAPTECPINTVRDTVRGEYERACRRCDAGYFCDVVGLGTLVGKQCSAGHYCPIGTSAMIKCPSGTYLTSTTQSAKSDCTTCTEHYYCPEGSANRIQCVAGQRCPTGSSSPQKCEAGNLCIVTNNSPYTLSNSPCPAGYYCPQGATAAIPCAGLSTSLCPAGSKFEGGQATSCEAGYYLSGSSCKYCDRGFVCEAGATKSNPKTTAEKGYICPVGHYCDPRISVKEIKCPVGTYNPKTEGKYISDCLACPAGYYNILTGQSGCLECGTGATSKSGATECSCIGAFRWWKSDKNTCECKKGYTSNPNKFKIFSTSGEFDALDCAPAMCNPTCGSGEFCNSEFVCESKACTNACPSGDGSFNENLQVCECANSPKTADSACGAECKSKASEFYYDSSASKYCCKFKCTSGDQIVCKTPTELNMYVAGGTITGNIPSMKSSTTGMQGSYQCPPTMMAFKPACATDIYAARRNLESGDKRDLAALASTFDQTLICLTSTVNTVTWDITKTSFPVYNKDHPLNDDTTFDSSAFETLKQKLLNSGVSLSTFTYSFSKVTTKIALAFNDYTNSKKLTVVALNRSNCTDGNVLPLNSQTLASVGINKASFLELDPMEDWLVIFPLLFLAFGILFGVLVKVIEDKIEKRRIANLKKKKEFIREDGSVDRIQYLRDLYNVIKQYLDNLNDDDPIKTLIDNENSSVERMKQSEEADNIKILIEKFFDDLRFINGELVEDKVLAESTDPSDEDRHSAEEPSAGEGEESEDFMAEEDEEDESMENMNLELDEILGPQEDRIEEKSEDEEDEKDIDAILAMKRENDKKRREYEESLRKLGLSDEERRDLMEKYEDSLRRAREMMEGDAEAQEKRRLQRLEDRKNRKQEGRRKLKELEDKAREINRGYKDQVDKLDNAIEEKVSHINEEVQKEEDQERRELDRKLKERLKRFKDNFYEKIKGKSGNNQKKLIAEHEKENERLQADLERERAYQEKKLLKNRDARRRRMIDDTTKDLADMKNDVLRDQADELEDIERQKLLIAAEYGLEDELYSHGPSKEDEAEEERRKLNNIKEIELLRLKQKQRFEKEFDEMIEDIVPEEAENFENLNNEINDERDEFRRRIASATNDVDKQKLIRELEEKELEWAEDLERQRQLQDQQLYEKKKRRELYRERNRCKLEAKHRDENLKKELELMEFEAYKRETEAIEKIHKLMDEKKNDKELPLLVYRMLEDMVGRRLDDQAKIQFYELSGKLSNLYTNIAFDKALARKSLEEDMNDKVKELDSRNVPSQEFQKEITRFQKELDTKGKEQEQDLIRKQMESEMDLREKLKEQNYNDKKALEEDLFKKKQEILQKLAKDFRNENILKLLMERSREELDERLLKIAEDKENDIQKIKLQLVAKNKKDLANMEKKLEEDLAKEKRQEEIQFEKKKKKMLKELKQKYLDGLKNRENLTKDQKEMLLKKHEEEISRFEIALAKEKERQFRRMREKLILKRLEAEKEKEHKRREARINRQIRDADEGEELRGRIQKRGKGKNASLIRQLTDVLSERMEQDYDKTSAIPRRHGINLNVMLRGFKDTITARQEKEGAFDPNLYLRFKGDQDEDELAFKRLKTEDISMRSGVTDGRGKPETTRLLRRIMRVEIISNKISESKAQQIINDLNKLIDILK